MRIAKGMRIVILATAAASCMPGAAPNGSEAAADNGSQRAFASRPSPSPQAAPPRQGCTDIPYHSANRHADKCDVGKVGTAAEPCFQLTAYYTDTKPGGRAVHAAPREASPVVGRILPPIFYHDGQEPPWGYPASFAIRDSKDGWLLIAGAADDPVWNGGKNRRMYHGQGWIRGEGVSVDPQASTAFAAPDFSSAPAVKRPGSEWLDSRIVAVEACNGNWVRLRWKFHDGDKVEINPPARLPEDPSVVRGWITGICDIPETTCDGLGGDPDRQR
jgi:hypothetical protein